LACHSSRYPIISLRLSAFNYRIIYIRQISLTPYVNLHPHTIRFGLFTISGYKKLFSIFV
jgi:hypothetical protein